MADIFSLTGSYVTNPAVGFPSADPTFSAGLDETLVLEDKSFSTLDLTSNSPTAVSFGGLDQANVVIIKTIGGKVSALLTSADGSAQAVPVDSLFILMSSSVPVTAISLTRETGIEVIVKVFLGKQP